MSTCVTSVECSVSSVKFLVTFSLYYIYKTNISTYSMHNITIYIPPICFDVDIAVTRECNTSSYLIHFKI